MKRLAKWGLGLVAVLATAGLTLTAVGSFLPRSHTIERSATLPVPVERVWEAVVNQQDVPSWWPSCKTSMPVPAGDGRTVWRQSHDCGCDCDLEVTESVPYRRFVTAITDSAGIFSGRWEYDFAPAEDGCRLTVTEFGEIHNPLVRVLARLGDQAETLDSFMTALTRHLQQSVAAK